MPSYSTSGYDFARRLSYLGYSVPTAEDKSTTSLPFSFVVRAMVNVRERSDSWVLPFIHDTSRLGWVLGNLRPKSAPLWVQLSMCASSSPNSGAFHGSVQHALPHMHTGIKEVRLSPPQAWIDTFIFAMPEVIQLNSPEILAAQRPRELPFLPSYVTFQTVKRNLEKGGAV